MLWYKCWLETRFFALFMVLYAIFPVALLTLTPRPANAPQGSVAAVEGAVGFLALYYSMIPVLLAGSGIKTQAGPSSTKGLYGSMYFTLSLPVSRFRLVATRAGIGMLETVGILAIAPCAVWIMFPPLRPHITGLDLLLYWLTLFMCGSAICFLGSTALNHSGRPLARLRQHVWRRVSPVAPLDAFVAAVRQYLPDYGRIVAAPHSHASLGQRGHLARRFGRSVPGRRPSRADARVLRSFSHLTKVDTHENNVAHLRGCLRGPGRHAGTVLQHGVGLRRRDSEHPGPADRRVSTERRACGRRRSIRPVVA